MLESVMILRLKINQNVFGVRKYFFFEKLLKHKTEKSKRKYAIS